MPYVGGPTKCAPDWWGCAAKLVYTWLKAGSVKAASSRPTHQRVTQTVGRFVCKIFNEHKRETNSSI